MTTIRDFAIATVIVFFAGLVLWHLVFAAILARTDIVQIAGGIGS